MTAAWDVLPSGFFPATGHRSDQGNCCGEGRRLGSSDCFPRGALGDATAALTRSGSTICSSVAHMTVLIHVVLHLGFGALSQPSPSKI